MREAREQEMMRLSLERKTSISATSSNIGGPGVDGSERSSLGAGSAMGSDSSGSSARGEEAYWEGGGRGHQRAVDGGGPLDIERRTASPGRSKRPPMSPKMSRV